MLIFGLTSLSAKGIAGCLVLLKWNWFIKAYMGLYILSPILNAFVNNTEKKTFKNVLISFFVFQTIYSWISDGAVFFENGYSTISFIGLYLLARYTKIYLAAKNTPPRQFLVNIWYHNNITNIDKFHVCKNGNFCDIREDVFLC